MKGYGQFCPVAKAAEIVAERWTPLVLRELLCGSRRFSDLHAGCRSCRPRFSPSAWNSSKTPGSSGACRGHTAAGGEYELTAAGEALRPLIDRLGEWGQRWARAQIGRDDLDAGLLMWDIHRRVDVDALPPERVVVRLDFRGAPATMRCPRTWWLLLARSEVDLCLRDPGFPVDVVGTADLRTLTRVWMGDVPMAAAVRAGSIRLEGPPSLVRAFPTWLRLSSFARVER